MKKIVIPLFCLILISGCVSQNFENTTAITFNEKLENVEIPSKYKSYLLGYGSSAGGDRYSESSFEINNEEAISCDGFYDYDGGSPKHEECKLNWSRTTISEILNEIKKLNTGTAVEYMFHDRICYKITRHLICFHNRTVVNYIAKETPYEFFWHIEGYEFTDEVWNILSPYLIEGYSLYKKSEKYQ